MDDFLVLVTRLLWVPRPVGRVRDDVTRGEPVLSPPLETPEVMTVRVGTLRLQ